MLTAIYPDISNFGMGEAAMVALEAILIVFVVLTLLIAVCALISYLIHKVEAKNKIMAKPQNKILDEDEDAVVATLVATIDFYKETKKDARVKSVEKIEE